MRRVALLVSVLIACGSAIGPAQAADTETAVRVATLLPNHHVDVVLPLDTDAYTIHHAIGDRVVVVVVGDGSTDVDLRIRDPLGRVVARDFDLTDDCICAFVAHLSGEYTIEVINRGVRANHYIMAWD